MCVNVCECAPSVAHNVQADVMRRIHHPAFIQYFDSFVEHGTLHIVMEYASGGDLAQLISRRKRR